MKAVDDMIKKILCLSLLLLLAILPAVSCGQEPENGTETKPETLPPETLPGETEPATETEAEIETLPGTEAETLADPSDPSYYHKMVVFGDSIAHGYGLRDMTNTRYSALIEEKMKTLPCEFTSFNYAVDGATSEDLYNLLRNGVRELKGADLVIISIGANNILRYSYTLLGQFQSGSPAAALEIMNSDEFAANMQSGIDRLGSDIPEILRLIRETASDADVVFQTIYNPYRGALVYLGVNGFEMKIDFGAKINGYVEGLNEKIRAGAAEYGYTVAEVHGAFEAHSGNLVNVILADNGSLTKDLDPHPDANGHRVIAEVILDTLKDLGKKLPA